MGSFARGVALEQRGFVGGDEQRQRAGVMLGAHRAEAIAAQRRAHAQADFLDFACQLGLRDRGEHAGRFQRDQLVAIGCPAIAAADQIVISSPGLCLGGFCLKNLRQKQLSSGLCKNKSIDTDLGAFGRVTAPTCGRSGGGAGAVRVRSLSPRPAGIGSPGAAVWPRLGLLLTPARWGAKRCAAHGRARCGSGGTVPDGTGRNRRRNRQHTQIIGQFSRFQRFHSGASRDACAGVCAQSRAYMRGVGVGTMEPTDHIVISQLVSSSVGGSVRFQAGTGAATSVEGAAIGHFLAGGYRRGAADRAGSGPWGARRGESFGCFGQLGGAAWRSRSRGRNGGFLPIWASPARRVGRVALEELAQGVDLAAQSGLRRQPVRLRRGAWARPIAAATPLLPPSPGRAASSSLALDLVGILDRHRAAPPLLALFEEDGRLDAGARQSWDGETGSGWGSDRSLARRRAGRWTGRGETRSGADFRGKLRRSGQASAGVAGVN